MGKVKPEHGIDTQSLSPKVGFNQVSEKLNGRAGDQ